MSGHPRGIYWLDMLEAQRSAAQGLGFTQTSWDEGALPPVVDLAVLDKKGGEEAPEPPVSEAMQKPLSCHRGSS